MNATSQVRTAVIAQDHSIDVNASLNRVTLPLHFTVITTHLFAVSAEVSSVPLECAFVRPLSPSRASTIHDVGGTLDDIRWAHSRRLRRVCGQILSNLPFILLACPHPLPIRLLRRDRHLWLNNGRRRDRYRRGGHCIHDVSATVTACKHPTSNYKINASPKLKRRRQRKHAWALLQM